MQYDSRAETEKLKKEYDRIRLTAYFMIAMVICVILVSAFRKFWLTLIIIAVTVFLQLFVFKKMQKKYTDHAVTENIRATIGQILHTDKVVMKGAELLDEQVIREADLIPAIDKSGAVNLFTAVSGYTGTKDRKMKVTSCDVTIAKHQEGARISAEIICGNWIHIELPEVTGYSFIVKDGRILPSIDREDAGEGERSADISESAEISEKFRRELEKLEEYTTGRISMRVKNDTTDIFLRDRFLAASFSARSEVTQQMIDWNPLPELEKVLDLVWTLT